MLISICVPCMNRTHDLRRTLPGMVEAARCSLPADVCVLDYNGSDGLRAFCQEARPTNGELVLGYARYDGNDGYYHLAHAYNLAVKASDGDYVCIMGADAVIAPSYVAECRRLIGHGAVWMRERHYKGIICIQRQAFDDAGGYDERFEYYGGEDKELEERLIRRGLEPAILPDGLVRTLRTPNSQKLVNYRGNLTKREMMQRGKRIRAENATKGLLVANEGQEWGAWA